MVNINGTSTGKRFVYKNLVQKPWADRMLNGLGNGINAFAKKFGISKNIYATGVTRNKAILFASNNPDEIKAARKSLLDSGCRRAKKAVYNYDSLVACKAAQKAGLTPEQFNELVDRIEGTEVRVWHFVQALPPAFEAAKRHIRFPLYITDLFSELISGDLAQRAENYDVVKAFRVLPTIMGEKQTFQTPRDLEQFLFEVKILVTREAIKS